MLRMIIGQSMIQTQKLIMTPKLQQAIKILQMPRMELVQYVSQELVENIALDDDDEDSEDDGDETEDEVAESEDEAPEADVDLETGLSETESDTSEEDLPEFDINYDDDFANSSVPNNEYEAPLDDGIRDTLAGAGESLEEYLLRQLRMAVELPEDYAIGEAVIGNIDNDGYLAVSIEEITELLKESHLLLQLEMVLELKEDYAIGEAIIKNMDDNSRLIITAEEVTELPKEDHLFWQLRMAVKIEKDHAIGEAIIENMNGDGDLTISVIEIADSLKRKVKDVERILQIVQDFEPLECKVEDVERILQIIQGFELLKCEVEDVERTLQLVQMFDPAGVGARDLKECLLIQLEQMRLVDTVAYEVVEEGYLEDLNANRLPKIAKKLKIDLEVVRAAKEVISALEPKPGREFSSIKPEYVIPDVEIAEMEGEYKVFMNDSGPSLRVSPSYRRMLKARDSLASETREYIQTKIQSANWLIDSIERRRITILRVTESVFEVQKDFLDKGTAYLKPLTLKDIAYKLGISESTVSRVTGSRYVQTPRGVFSLKYFFKSGISTDSGEKASSESVREIIREMVDKEDPQNPLSDKDIGIQLKQKGFGIARRTIAKYRGELGLPNSSKRKKW